MHGRVKTRTTEEQEKIAKQEKEKKIKNYKNAMKLLIDKRLSECYDQEAIDVTSNLLIANPDILTGWNYRRDVFLHMKNQLEKDEFRKLLEKDLILTEQCLKINPKSYANWHHRVWVLKNMPEPNWEKELFLSKKYLELDERNFHCWDYRRFVTQVSNVPDLLEYEFTLEKIKNNFSNYSAWHLRSKLLPKIFPSIENNLPVSESKHKEELELVQNAAFTDPNDQSAWFYQRWLLAISEPRIHFIVVEVVENQVIVALSKSLNQNSKANCGAVINLEINNEKKSGVWTNTSSEPQSSVWMCNLQNNLSKTDQITLSLVEDGVTHDVVHLEQFVYIKKKPNFVGNFNTCLKRALIEELSTCRQLLEIEPDSKWTNLTSLHLMESIDAVLYEGEIELGLKNLIAVDPLRQGYYEDISSKFIIESAIRHHYNNYSNFVHLKNSKFAIINKNLTCLYHMQYFLLLEYIDLSSNCLKSRSLTSLHCLLNCKYLKLDNNKIKTLKYLPLLPKLTFLSLCNNCIEESSSKYLNKFPELKEIYL